MFPVTALPKLSWMDDIYSVYRSNIFFCLPTLAPGKRAFHQLASEVVLDADTKLKQSAKHGLRANYHIWRTATYSKIRNLNRSSSGLNFFTQGGGSLRPHVCLVAYLKAVTQRKHVIVNAVLSLNISRYFRHFQRCIIRKKRARTCAHSRFVSFGNRTVCLYGHRNLHWVKACDKGDMKTMPAKNLV